MRRLKKRANDGRRSERQNTFYLENYDSHHPDRGTVWKDPRGRKNQGYDTRAIQGDGDAEHCFNVKERM